MQYEGNIIRPPSEANSIILQATVGCSHNACSFCGAYRNKRFYIKDKAIILEDLEFAAKYCLRQKTLFLADGNGLAIPQTELQNLLELIKERLQNVRRVSLYANSNDILKRSAEELIALKDLGLGRIYMGLESGHDLVLRNICKDADSKKMIQAGRRVREAGIFLSVTVLLGIGGTDLSQEHAQATADVLNLMEPSQIAVLTLMLLDNTPLGREYNKGRFRLPGQEGLLKELRTMLVNLDLEKAQFQSNHASNYLALEGRLPRDKKKFIALVDQAIDGAIALKPESLRAL